MTKLFLTIIVGLLLFVQPSYAVDEAIRGRSQQVIGYLRPESGQDRITVLDACRIGLGYTSSKGTFTMSNVRLADSPIPFLLLQGSGACGLTKANLP